MRKIAIDMPFNGQIKEVRAKIEVSNGSKPNILDTFNLENDCLEVLSKSQSTIEADKSLLTALYNSVCHIKRHKLTFNIAQTISSKGFIKLLGSSKALKIDQKGNIIYRELVNTSVKDSKITYNETFLSKMDIQKASNSKPKLNTRIADKIKQQYNIIIELATLLKTNRIDKEAKLTS